MLAADHTSEQPNAAQAMHQCKYKKLARLQAAKPCSMHSRNMIFPSNDLHVPYSTTYCPLPAVLAAAITNHSFLMLSHRRSSGIRD